MAKKKTKLNNFNITVVIAVLLFLSSFALMYHPPQKLHSAVQGFNTRDQNLQQVATLEAVEKLEGLKESLATTAGRIDEVNHKQIELTRSDFKKGYENSNQLAKISWQKIDMQLSKLEETVRDGGGDLIAAIDDALKSLNESLSETKGENI